MNKVIGFFDLYSQYRRADARAQSASDEETAGWRQAVVYLACLVGIFAGPFALEAAKGKYPPLAQLLGGWGHVFWSVLFAFILTAALFKLWLSPRTPIVGQIGVAIAVGIGSGELIPVALDALTTFAK
jgi:hypothetical protein